MAQPAFPQKKAFRMFLAGRQQFFVIAIIFGHQTARRLALNQGAVCQLDVTAGEFIGTELAKFFFLF